MAWMISGDRKTEETIFMHQLKCNETSNENSSDAHFKPLYQQRERKKKLNLKKTPNVANAMKTQAGQPRVRHFNFVTKI